MRRSALILLVLLAIGANAAAAPVAHAQTTSQRIVSLARAELARGVHEVPDGSNRGGRIRMYGLATAGRYYPAPWCAYFASYVARRAGVPIGPGGAGLGYVPYIRAWAKQTGRFTKSPRPGYLIVFPQHVGIVETVASNRTLTTIEGNSGNAVRRRYRGWGEAMGYVRLAAGGAITAPGVAPAPTAGAGQALTARITAYPGLQIAEGQTVDFTSNDSSGEIARSDWDLGSGALSTRGDNVSRRYDVAGTYLVRLRVTDRRHRTATTTATLVVRSNKPPVAALQIAPGTSVVAGTTITGDASASTDPDGRIVRYAWDLDGNGQWGDDGPQHSITLSTPGDYIVGLRVYDDDGNMTETHAAVHVADVPPPVVRATCAAPSVVSGQRLTCTAETTGSPVRIVKVQWDMNGDGAFEATGTSATATFATPGTTTVTAKATDAKGRTAVASVDVRVDDRPPVARLGGPSTVALGAAVSLDASASTDPDGRVVSFAWDLDGDGAPDPAPPATPDGHVTFTPAAPGPRTVRVWVTDDGGATSVASLALTVTNRPPVARITAPSTAAVGATVTVDATRSTDPDGTVATYEWDLDGDGTYETQGATAPLTLARAGALTIRLRVTDAFGATATAAKTITAS